MGEIFQIASAILLSFGASGAILFALSSWLGKVWANRILEKEKLAYSELLAKVTNQLEFQLHSSKAVFDTELKIYRELWEAANKLKHLAINIRPWHGQGEMTQEQIAINYKFLQDEIISFDLFINSNKPFFTPAIFNALSHLRATVSIENKMAVSNTSPDGMAYAMNRHETVIPILEASEEVCNLIHERLFSNNTSFSVNKSSN